MPTGRTGGAQVPWAALGAQQVQVEVDRLYLVAVPNYLQEAAPPQDGSEEEARLAARKVAQLAAAEERWVAAMQSREQRSAAAAQPGYIQGVINVVLGNLKLTARARAPASLRAARVVCLGGELLRSVRSRRPPPPALTAYAAAGHQSAYTLRGRRYAAGPPLCVRHHAAKRRCGHR